MDGVVGLQIYTANSPIIIDHHRSPTLREAIDFSITSHFQWQALILLTGVIFHSISFSYCMIMKSFSLFSLAMSGVVSVYIKTSAT